MKQLPSKDAPLVPGGVKPTDTGDCIPDPFPFPDYPTFPVVPTEMDPMNAIDV